MQAVRLRGVRYVWISLAMLSLLCSGRIAGAQSNDLDDVAQSIAADVATALKGVPGGVANGVNVKSIQGRETGGPGFRAALIGALRDQGVMLSRGSKYGIEGSVKAGGASRGASAAAAAVASVNLSLTGPSLDRQLTGLVQAETDVIALVGVTGTLPVVADRPVAGISAPVPAGGRAVAVNEAERQAKLASLIVDPEPPAVKPNPTPFVDTTTGRPELSEVHVGPYAIEVLIEDPNGRVQTADGTRYNPRPPVKAENGELRVDIQPGEIYAVKLINDAKSYDTGVKLTIDGLDSFEFSEEAGYKKLGMWVIPHESSGIVRGWHLRNKEGESILAKFEVGKYGEGAAEEMGAYGDVGKITATFRAAWDPSENTPGSMLAYSNVRGTKKGEEISENLTEFRRHFGEVRAAISIRYQIAEQK